MEQITPAGLSAKAPRLSAGGTFWVGYSGGPDSTALLSLLRETPLRIKAVHVNHHLQPRADAWAEHCREQCRAWEIPLRVLDVTVEPGHAAGPEGAAREMRYAALRGVMASGDCLVTAHHLDDQAETVLLRLLRGTGLDGLAAMRPLTSFAPGLLWRPLLATPRAALRAYAAQAGLRFVTDPHNLDPRYARAYLRRDVLPRLQERFPGADAALARIATFATEGQELLAALAEHDLPGEGPVEVARLARLPEPRRRNALRGWLQRQGVTMPPAATLAQVDREVLGARADAAPCVAWDAWEVRRYRERLHVMPRLSPAPGDTELIWAQGRKLELPLGCGELSARGTPPVPFAVRFMRGGERFKPAGGRHTRTLKNLFQEKGVPPWVRVRTPLLYIDKRLVGIADLWRSVDWPARLRKFQVRWRHRLPQ